MLQTIETMSSRLEKVSKGLTVLASLCLLAIVAIVTIGVLMRYIFASPILGLNEIVQLAAVALVMAALPYATAIGDHVAVDVFEQWLGRWGRFIGDILSRIMSAALLGFLTHRAVLKALDAMEWGDATNMLQLPIWPFYAIIAAGAVLCALIFVVEIVLIVLKGPQE